MAKDIFLLLHGWGGNKPEHWQEYLFTKLTETGCKVHYPKMPDPTAPDPAAWQERLRNELAEIASQSPDAKLTVLAHSLGSINWMRYVVNVNGAGGKQIADRVLLVSPPYILPEAPPLDLASGAPAFFPPPFDPAAMTASAATTTIIASDTDDYTTYDQAVGLAAKVGVPIELLKGGGHISPYYGYGEWPWVLEWCLRRAEFPPVK